MIPSRVYLINALKKTFKRWRTISPLLDGIVEDIIIKKTYRKYIIKCAKQIFANYSNAGNINISNKDIFIIVH